MKKLLLALPLVAGASWAGTSYYAGVQSETAYDQFLNQTKIMEPLVFEKESFDNGISTSHAITAVRESAAADAKIIFRLQHEINHSPIQVGDDGTQIGTATIRTTLVNDTDNERLVAARKLFNGQEPFEILSKADVNGKIASTITLEAVDFTTLGESVSLGKSSFDVITENNRTQGNGTLGELQHTLDNGVILTGSSSDLDFDINFDGTWTYDYNLKWSMDELSANSPDFPNAVKALNLSIGTDSKLANDKAEQTAFFEIGNIDFGDLMPADSAPVNSGRISGEFVGMDLSGLKAYSERFSKMTIEEQMQASLETDAETLSLMVSLLSRGAAVNYALELGNPAGAATANYSVRFIGDDSDSGYDDIVTLADVLNAIEMDINVNVDKAALEMTPAAMFMGSPQMQMAFVDTGDQLVSKASLRGTAVEVNGNFYALQDMVGEMLDMPFESMLEMDGM